MEALKLVLLLVALLVPEKPVDAACNQCVDAHACTAEGHFQICYNGVRDQNITYPCPEDKPICTEYNIICMPDSPGTPRTCGDVSQCGICTGANIFACTSLTTFAVCNNGVAAGDNYSCASEYVCSVKAAQVGDPCITRCNSDNSDICDRVLDPDDDDVTTASTESSTESSPTVTSSDTSSSTITTETSTETSSSTDTSTESSPTVTSSDTSSSTITTGTSTETSSSTDTSTESSSTVTSSDTSSSTITTETSTETSSSTDSTITTAAPPFNEVVYCQGLNSTGRYPIPNDTACTSYIYCVFKATGYVGILYNCTPEKPYFDADIRTCGTVRPTLAGCTN